MGEFHMSQEESAFAQQHFQQLTKSSMNLYITVSQAKQFMLMVDLSMDTMKQLFTRFFKSIPQFSFNDFGKMLRLLSAQQQSNILQLPDAEIQDKILAAPTFYIVKLRQTTQIPNSSTQNMQPNVSQDPAFWEREGLRDEGKIPLSSTGIYAFSAAPASMSAVQAIPSLAPSAPTLRATHSQTSLRAFYPILIPADGMHALGEETMAEISKKQAAINTLVQELQDNDPNLSFVVSRAQAAQLKKQITELSKAAETGFDGLFSYLKSQNSKDQFEALSGLTKQAMAALSEKMMSVYAYISDFYTQFTRLSDSLNLLKMNEFSYSLDTVRQRFQSTYKMEIDLERVGSQYEEIKAANEVLRDFVAYMDAQDEDIRAQTAALQNRLAQLRMDRQTVLQRVTRIADSSYETGLVAGFEAAISDFARFREFISADVSAEVAESPDKMKNSSRDEVQDDEFWGDVGQDQAGQDGKASDSADKAPEQPSAEYAKYQ